MAPQSSDTDPLTASPDRRPSLTEGHDAPHHFMTGNASRSQSGIGARDVGGVRAADPAGFDRNQHLASAGRRRLAFGYFERTGLCDLREAIGSFHVIASVGRH